jgi:hypothetical protein
MPKPTSGRRTHHARYWEKRLGSRQFKQALTAVIQREMSALARQHVREVLDAKLVGAIIKEWDGELVDRNVLADLIVHGNRRAGTRLSRRRDSLADLVDRQLLDGIDDILAEDLELSPHVEELIAKMMQQEFFRKLFTDIIFTAIVSFYQRVNPLFGALTMHVLEEQIKGFIRLFMPMIQKQATAFAVSKHNQRIVRDFARSILRELLAQPLGHFADMVTPGQRRKGEALIRTAVRSAEMDALVRTATLAAWDDIYAGIENKRVGELLRLDEHGAWLAARLVAVITPALARPHVLAFVAAEVARYAEHASGFRR